MSHKILLLCTVGLLTQGCSQFVFNRPPQPDAYIHGPDYEKRREEFPLAYCKYEPDSLNKAVPLKIKDVNCVTPPDGILGLSITTAHPEIRCYQKTRPNIYPLEWQEPTNKDGPCPHDFDDDGEFISNSVYPQSEHQRLLDILEKPFMGNDGKPKLGIALSGGGTKAAAFGMGVLAGMADNGLLERTDYLSTVSGGGYAAYFLYSQTLLPKVWNIAAPPVPPVSEAKPAAAEGTIKPDQLAPLFADCLTHPTLKMPPKPSEINNDMLVTAGAQNIFNQYRCQPTATITWPTPTLPPATQNEDMAQPQLAQNRQAFVRCSSDIFRPGKCSISENGLLSGLSLISVLGTVGSIPFNFITNTLFDTGIRISASAATYEDGIGTGFGAIPAKSFVYPTPEKQIKGIDCHDPTPRHATGVTFPAATESLVLGCRSRKEVTKDDQAPDMTQPGAAELQFAHIKAALEQQSQKDYRYPKLPFWIINASSPRFRSANSWFTGNNYNLKDVFEMTPLSHGSTRYGFVPQNMALHGMRPINAVEAAAAFFDSTEENLPQPARGLLGLLQRIGNFEWGIDIANYNVNGTRTFAHRFVPFPFYWFDGGLDQTTQRELHRHECALAKQKSDMTSFMSLHCQEAEVADLLARADNQLAALPEATKNALKDRRRSSMIRLIDGGNTEDLGLYSLIRRKVPNIIISDAASDGHGKFEDICKLKLGLRMEGKYLYVPGLHDLETYCAKDQAVPGDSESDIKQRRKEYTEYQSRGFNLYEWNFDFPVLLGCVRTKPGAQSQPCNVAENRDADNKRVDHQDGNDSNNVQRLFFVKPALNYRKYKDKIAITYDQSGKEHKQLFNCWAPAKELTETQPSDTDRRLPGCEVGTYLLRKEIENYNDGACPEFPHNTTVAMTVNSSPTLYAAHRELARQYTYFAARMLRKLLDSKDEGVKEFNKVILEQEQQALVAVPIQGADETGGINNSCKKMQPLQEDKYIRARQSGK